MGSRRQYHHHQARRVGLTALLTALAATSALATGTPAGTDIVNVASISYHDGFKSQTVLSNRSALRVDEVIDVTVSPLGPPMPVAPGDLERALPFLVTNSGNGPETFRLAADTMIAGDDFDGVLVRLAFDTNGDGRYDPLVDTAYLPGSNDPLLGPDASVTVFVIANLPATLTDGSRALEALEAIAVTGSGAPGTLFRGAGQNGSDAVVGTTRAIASAQGVLVASLAVPEIVKSQAMIGPDGEPAAVPGAIITYTLSVRYSGTLIASAALVRDAIPTGTTYVPASLKLDGAPLTDPAGDDAGEGSAAGIAVRLGTLVSGAVQTVSFQVRVNN